MGGSKVYINATAIFAHGPRASALGIWQVIFAATNRICPYQFQKKGTLCLVNLCLQALFEALP